MRNDERGVAIIFRGVIVIVSMFMLVLFSLMAGAFIDPFVQAALDSSGAQSLGLDDGLSTAWRIGLGLVLPLLGVAVLIYAHTAEFSNDTGRRRRY